MFCLSPGWLQCPCSQCVCATGMWCTVLRGMPWPHPAVPSPTLALAGWCPLSPTGAQTTQLLVEPPWSPAVLWDRVTLTCQGSGTAGATTWYKDGQHWWKEGRNHFTVTESGTYMCDRPGSGLSAPMRVSNDWLVLQEPARVLLEGDTVTLRCRSWQNKPLTDVSFYHKEKLLKGSHHGTELSLSPLRLHHSGHYHCKGWVALGDSLVLSCTVATGTGPLSFSWHREGSGAPLGTGPRLELRHAGDNDSGQYRCRVSDGDSVAESDPLNVTVLGEQDPRAGGDLTHGTPIPTRPVPALSVSPQCPWPMPPSPPVPWHTRCMQVTM
uniref:Uncharacterized protein n=1 Tax=Geospiza parvula TaxID=87175 RepID=A0A8C3N8D5_GEOPR